MQIRKRPQRPTKRFFHIAYANSYAKLTPGYANPTPAYANTLPTPTLRQPTPESIPTPSLRQPTPILRQPTPAHNSKKNKNKEPPRCRNSLMRFPDLESIWVPSGPDGGCLVVIKKLTKAGATSTRKQVTEIKGHNWLPPGWRVLAYAKLTPNLRQSYAKPSVPFWPTGRHMSATLFRPPSRPAILNKRMPR